MFDLTGRTALVTGATGGIGGAIAHTLHANGATVTISGTRIEMLDSLAGQLGGRVHVVRCNLTDREDVENLVPAAEAAMGHIDILINNAAITRDNLVVRLKDEDWDQVLAVDLTAAFRLIRAAVRGMIRRRFGRIIGVTSVVGLTGNAGQANYAAAKAGMIGLTKTLAREFAGRSVTVNAVAPGFIKTDMTAEFVNNPEVSARILEAVPLKRFGEAADIANLTAYLCSEEAGYITGQVFSVDGGMAM